MIAGDKTRNVKTLKGTYASEQDGLTAARAERRRLERGMATFELPLALGRPELMPKSPVRVTGFKEDIDGHGWLVKEVCHTLSDGGWAARCRWNGVAKPPTLSALP